MFNRLKFSVTAYLCVAWAAQAQTITGIITTIAGNGTQGFAGDSGPALSANLNQPFAAVSVGGNLYIADQVNNAIRLVNSSGTISTLAGANGAGYSGDLGKATAAQLSQPTGVVVDSSGNVYIADTNNHCVRIVSTSGIIKTFAGTCALSGYGGDGSGAAGSLMNKPSGLAFDSNGNLYISDNGNNVIRMLMISGVSSCVSTSTCIITTYAGNFAKGGSYIGDGSTALNAGMNAPTAINFDKQGNLYIADSGNNVVRKVATNRIITTVAGNGTSGFTGDGTRLPTLSELSHPKGVAVDSSGNVYISDTLNNRIRVVPPNGASINTVIGTGQAAYFGDNGPGSQAGLWNPGGLTFDSSGNLIIADTSNNVIRKFVPGGSSGSAPVISAGGVVSASQFGEFSTIAPGTWIEIYGSNLANTTMDWSNSFTGNNAPKTLGGTTVTIGGLNAYISYISPGQVDAQVPFSLSTGSQSLAVSTAAGQSANYSINVTNTQAGLYAPANLTVGGKQYVGAFHQDGTLVMPAGAVANVTSSPAKVGEIITMYGVGFGQVTPMQTDGQVAQGQSSLTTPLNISFGQVSGSFQNGYFGLAPGYLGLYQFNITVPNVASNSAIPLSFILGSSNNAQTLYTAVQ